MANLLPIPIAVRAGRMSAEATHSQFGVTAQRWNEGGPLNIYEVLGFEEERGDGSREFIPVNGVRGDTGEHTPTHALSSAAEYDAWASQPETQAALYKLKQLYDYIRADRNAARKPEWLP